MSTTKEEAYSILREGLQSYVNKLFTVKYGSAWKSNPACTQGKSCEELLSNPLQTILQFWTPVFQQHAPFKLDSISTLALLQRKQLDQDQLSRVITLMETTLISVGEHQKAAKLKKSTNNNEGNGMKGIEGVALAGGAAAAGYLLYKGASYLLNQLSLEDGNEDGRDNRRVIVDEDAIEGNHASVKQLRESANSGREPTIVDSAAGHAVTQTHETTDGEEDSPFICPITLQLMEDPVITPQGICFERKAILDWLSKKNTCPITNEPLSADKLITCYALKNAITDYKKQKEKQSVSPQSSASSSKLAAEAPSSSSVLPAEVPAPSSPTSSPASSPISASASVLASASSVVPSKPVTKIEVSRSIAKHVEIWSAAALCSEDRCPHYPEGSKYIVFPASKNFIVDKCTGYITFENRGDHDVTLISREREANAWEPFNIGARFVGSFVLRAHSRQGFDFRGYFCIEIPYEDIRKHSVDIVVTEFGREGGGRGNGLKMANK